MDTFIAVHDRLGNPNEANHTLQKKIVELVKLERDKHFISNQEQ